MGNLRTAIFSSNECKLLVSEYKNDFFPTAAGDLWTWYEKGGKLKEAGGKFSFRNFPELFSASGEPLYGKEFDLNRYDAIIFVGQWIRPLQYLGLTDWYKSNPPPSYDQLKRIARNIIENPFIPGSGLNQIPNEPLVKFPSIVSEASRIILVPDPLPGRPPLDNKILRPINYRDQFDVYRSNLKFVKLFYETLQEICIKNGIQYCFQPDSTFDPESLTTHSEFMEFNDECIHVNVNFYFRLLSESISSVVNKLPNKLN